MAEENTQNPALTRLFNESSELAVRISKLADFIESEKFKTLDAVSKGLLTTQLCIMEAYYNTLVMRIANWKD